jgi:hypothetical protein
MYFEAAAIDGTDEYTHREGNMPVDMAACNIRDLVLLP